MQQTAAQRLIRWVHTHIREQAPLRLGGHAEVLVVHLRQMAEQESDAVIEQAVAAVAASPTPDEVFVEVPPIVWPGGADTGAGRGTVAYPARLGARSPSSTGTTPPLARSPNLIPRSPGLPKAATARGDQRSPVLGARPSPRIIMSRPAPVSPQQAELIRLRREAFGIAPPRISARTSPGKGRQTPPKHTKKGQGGGSEGGGDAASPVNSESTALLGAWLYCRTHSTPAALPLCLCAVPVRIKSRLGDDVRIVTVASSIAYKHLKLKLAAKYGVPHGTLR